MRGNMPLGEVSQDDATYTSSNGCKIGPCAPSTGFSGNCFEPAMKGAIARAYFYLSTVCNVKLSGAGEEEGVKGWKRSLVRDGNIF